MELGYRGVTLMMSICAPGLTGSPFPCPPIGSRAISYSTGIVGNLHGSSERVLSLNGGVRRVAICPGEVGRTSSLVAWACRGWRPGEEGTLMLQPVTVTFEKWPDTLHWSVEAYLLRSDRHGAGSGRDEALASRLGTAGPAPPLPIR